MCIVYFNAYTGTLLGINIYTLCIYIYIGLGQEIEEFLCIVALIVLMQRDLCFYRDPDKHEKIRLSNKL